MNPVRKPWVVAIHEFVCGPGAANHTGKRARSAHVFTSLQEAEAFVKWTTENGKAGRWTLIVDGDPRGAGGIADDWDMASESVFMHDEQLAPPAPVV